MDIAAIVSVIGALVTVGGMYIAFRKSKPEIKVLNSQEQLNLAGALKQAVDALSDSMTASSVERQSWEKRVEQLEKDQEERDRKIKELQEHREERDKLLAELKDENEALRAGIAGLNKQIEKDTNETEVLRGMIANLEERYGRMKRVNEKLVKTLEDARERGLDIQLPDFNGDLTDSVKGLKWRK